MRLLGSIKSWGFPLAVIVGFLLAAAFALSALATVAPSLASIARVRPDGSVQSDAAVVSSIPRAHSRGTQSVARSRHIGARCPVLPFEERP
jgi:hypothetical protein